MFAIFIFSFSTFHNIFVIKYWTLSLKIESLIDDEQQISYEQTRKINIIFWFLQGLIFFSTGMYIGVGYKCFDRQFPYRQLEITNNCLAITVSIVDNLFIVDAFRRLKNSLKHEQIGISKKHIVLYLGSFFTATVALVFLYSATTLGLYGFGDGQNKKHLQYVMLSTELCIVLLTVSTVPSFFIFNLLLNQMIKQKKDNLLQFNFNDNESTEESPQELPAQQPSQPLRDPVLNYSERIPVKVQGQGVAKLEEILKVIAVKQV